MSTYPKKILSLHIEKTAGTTLQAFWEDVFGKENILIYNMEHHKLIRSSDFLIPRTSYKYEEIKYHFNKYSSVRFLYRKAIRVLNNLSFRLHGISPDAQIIDHNVVHGHFDHQMFRKKFRDYYTVTILRDPLERMISQYLHWKNSFGVSYWRKNIAYNSKVTFEEYAMMPELQNYQSNALDSLDLKEFDLIGVTDYLDIFLREIVNELQISPIPSLKKLNKYRGRHTIKVSSQFESEFKRFHSLDYCIYDKVKEHKVFRGKKT